MRHCCARFQGTYRAAASLTWPPQSAMLRTAVGSLRTTYQRRAMGACRPTADGYRRPLRRSPIAVDSWRHVPQPVFGGGRLWGTLPCGGLGFSTSRHDR